MTANIDLLFKINEISFTMSWEMTRSTSIFVVSEVFNPLSFF